jgi:hypothetical protein
MTVTVKMNTNAAQCNADGIFSSNIRPSVFFRETVTEVVKAGSAGARGFARGYKWYVVRYGAGYAFVTDRDIQN